MGKLIYIIIGLLLILMITPVLAQQSQKTNKIFLEPFYRLQMIDGTPYTYSLTIDPPEGATFVQSAIITLQIWHNPTITYSITVDGQACNTASFTVSTTYANAGEGTILFDCSNVITGAGTYTIIITTDDDTGANTAWADVTYTSRPAPGLTFGATDYYDYEDRQLVFVQLLTNEHNGETIDDGVCFADVWNSNVDTKLIDYSPMVFAEDGLYHLHTMIDELGVHPISVQCYYDYNFTLVNVSSTNTIYGNYTLLSGKIGYDFFYDEDGSPSVNHSTSVYTLGGTVTLRADWDNKWERISTSTPAVNGDSVNIYSKNINKLGDTIYLHDITGTIIYGSYLINSTTFFEWHNITLANTGAGITQIYISDLSQGGAHDIEWDYIDVTTAGGGGWIGNPDINNSVSSLGGEDNVYWLAVEDENDRLEIIFNITGITGIINETANLFINGKWSETTEDLDILIYNYNFSTWDLLTNKITYSASDTDHNNNIVNLSNYVSGGSLLVMINHTLVNTDYGMLALDKLNLEIFAAGGLFIDDVKGGGEIHIINVTGISNSVWTYPDRQLTELNFDTTDEEAIWEYTGNISVNITDQFASAIWNFNGTIISNIIDQFINALPDFNITVETNVTVNVTVNIDEVNISNIADIWEFENRTLTAFPFDVNATVLNQVNATVADVFVGGTEYVNNDSAKIAIRIIKNQGGSSALPEVGAECNVTILDPTNAPIYNASLMTEYGDGVYTFDFPTDDTDGVFTYFTDCSSAIGSRDYFSLNTFHVGLIDEESISGSVWNNPSRNLTEFDFEVNATITNIDDITNNVWNATDRNLTYYEDVTNYTLIEELLNVTVNVIVNVDEVNISNIDEFIANVWNATDRNLTYYEDVTNYTLIEELLNVTIENNITINVTTEIVNVTTEIVDITVINQTVDPAEIWNFENRTLTDFNFTVTTSFNISDINGTDIAQAVWNYEGNISNNIITTLGDYTACVVESLFNNEDGWGVQIRDCLEN